MEHGQLSIQDLFLQAGPVVKGVFVLLVLSSVWSWAIMLRSWIGLRRVKALLGCVVERRLSNPAASAIIGAGQREAACFDPGETSAERRHRITGTVRRRAQEAIEREQSGLGNLAVISSVAPFVGLFGTVWGIMTSFVGIAAAKDTSLAVVAPGIAEALGATAIGLAAAIPAAFAYNRFATSFAVVSRRLQRALEEVAGEIAIAVPAQPRSDKHGVPVE